MLSHGGPCILSSLLSYDIAQVSLIPKTEKKEAFTTTTERKSFGELFWLQRKTFQTGGNHIYHRNLSSVAPIFFGKESSALEQGGVCFLFPSQNGKALFWREGRFWDPKIHCVFCVRKSQLQSQNNRDTWCTQRITGQLVGLVRSCGVVPVPAEANPIKEKTKRTSSGKVVSSAEGPSS